MGVSQGKKSKNMITNGFLYIIYAVVWVITYPLRALNDATLSPSFTSALGTVSSYMTAVYDILPQSTGALLGALATLISIEVGIFIYKQIMWGIKRIPTQSGGGEG